MGTLEHIFKSGSAVNIINLCKWILLVRVCNVGHLNEIIFSKIQNIMFYLKLKFRHNCWNQLKYVSFCENNSNALSLISITKFRVQSCYKILLFKVNSKLSYILAEAQVVLDHVISYSSFESINTIIQKLHIDVSLTKHVNTPLVFYI